MTEEPQELVPLEEIRGVPFVVEVKGLRRLAFAPHADHGDRRIEWVPTAVAAELMARFNSRFQKLAIAQDLLALSTPAAEVPVVEAPKPKIKAKSKAKKPAKAT